MRLFLSCAELGLGHVTRIIPLGKRLAGRGHELFFFAGGTACKLLEKEFTNVQRCRPVAWYETSRGVSTPASLLNILVPLPYLNQENNRLNIKSPSGLETVHRYYDLRRLIRKIKPDLMIADGDMLALRLAQRWKIPTIYITNIIRPSCGFSSLLTPGERFTERYVRKCTRIIVPDNPPPYTICEYNLGDLHRMNIIDKVDFVGSFIDTNPIKGSEKHIYAPISGPLGTRATLISKIIPVFTQLNVRTIISMGQPGKKATQEVGNCTTHTWVSADERIELMRNAQLIVFSAGHGTCFETIKYAKPSICIPTQPEQIGNAKKLEKLHCSITARKSEELRLAIQKIQGDMSHYKAPVENLNQISGKFNGVDHAVTIIENITRA
jgi:UDP-N-acetylglucosamine--N-acetylmuramyl-(pentapeptide) pyrophosphoryl-undecaprenol N-acetylglucosamine transferase